VLSRINPLFDYKLWIFNRIFKKSTTEVTEFHGGFGTKIFSSSVELRVLRG